MSNPDPQNRRRSQQVLLQVGVFITAEVTDGSRLRVRAFTQVVNAHGGLLDAPFRMTVGQRLTILNPQSDQEVGCHVIRVDGPSDGSFPTVFEFDGLNPHFWPIGFPPVDWSQAQDFL